MFSDGVRFDEYDDPRARRLRQQQQQQRGGGAEDDDDASTSESDSGDESEVSQSSQRGQAAQAPKQKVLKKATSSGSKKGGSAAANVVDAAEYQKMRAREEWLRATGQIPDGPSSVSPSPPRRPPPQQQQSLSASESATAASPMSRRVLSASTVDVTFTTEAAKAAQQKILQQQSRTTARPDSAKGRMNSADDPLVRHLSSFSSGGGAGGGGGVHVDPSKLGDTFSASELQAARLKASRLQTYRNEPAVTEATSKDVPQGFYAPVAGKKEKRGQGHAAQGDVGHEQRQASSAPPHFLTEAARAHVSDGDAAAAAAGEPVGVESNANTSDSRRDFLKLLDLLGGSEDLVAANLRAAEVEREQQHAELLRKIAESNTARMKSATVDRHLHTSRQQHDQALAERFKAWVARDDDAPFIAEREDQLARMACDGPFDPVAFRERMQHSNDFFEKQRAAMARFEEAVGVLEDLVVSTKFVTKVNQFLQKYHKEFLQSLPDRARGEFRHAEFDVFRKYSDMVQKMILDTLRKKIKGFDEDEFFDRVFDAKMRAQVDPDEPPEPLEDEVDDAASNNESESDTSKWRSRRKVARNLSAADASEESALSYEVWEVLLSFLKFECFNDLMDEFISSFYGTTVASSSVLPANAGIALLPSDAPMRGGGAAAASSARSSVSSRLSVSTTASTAVSGAAASASSGGLTRRSLSPSVASVASAGSIGATSVKRGPSPSPATSLETKRSLREMRNLPTKK